MRKSRYRAEPNFFIIGAPKCGTTALSTYLRTHPKVFFSEPKEPQYFAADFKGRVISTEKDYLKLFLNANPDYHIAIGEGSVHYLYSRVAVPNILAFQPNAKFIVMLRNPADMLISLYSQLIIDGEEYLPSFVEAFAAEEERKRGNKIPIGCRDAKSLFYSDWGRLGTQLKRVLDVVPRNRVKIIIFEDFTSDTRSVYLDVLDFLGLPDDGRLEFPRVNERRMLRFSMLSSVLAVFMRLWIPLRSRVTLGKGLGLGAFLVRWNSLPAERENTPEVRQMLVDYYLDEISLLEGLLGHDLNHWKREA